MHIDWHWSADHILRRTVLEYTSVINTLALEVIPRLENSFTGNTAAANNTLGPNPKVLVASYEDQKREHGRIKKVLLECDLCSIKFTSTNHALIET